MANGIDEAESPDWGKYLNEIDTNQYENHIKLLKEEGFNTESIEQTKEEKQPGNNQSLNVSGVQENRNEQSEQVEVNQNIPISAQIAQLWQLKQEGALTEEDVLCALQEMQGKADSSNKFQTTKGNMLPKRTEILNEEWEKLHDKFVNSRLFDKKEFEEKQAFLMRLRRAISWLYRAQQMEMDIKGTDLYSQFIFLWIGFNSLYAKDPHKPRVKEFEQIKKYFQTLSKCSIDQVTDRIYKVIDSDISKKKIRSLSNNEFVSMDFWDKKVGVFKKGKEKDQPLPEPLSKEKTFNILLCIFQRLYIFRNRLMHGSTTWGREFNKDQLIDGTEIMHWLLPVFIEIMLKTPEGKWKLWGKVYFPPV